jgi:uncharacterized YigZ family protein
MAGPDSQTSEQNNKDPWWQEYCSIDKFNKIKHNISLLTIVHDQVTPTNYNLKRNWSYLSQRVLKHPHRQGKPSKSPMSLKNQRIPVKREDFMMNEYRTVRSNGRAEYEIKKSLFIAYVAPAATEQTAHEFIHTIKKKHYEASHNCSAYLIGLHDDIQKADDDGEPSGTAGRPILEVLRKSAVKNIVIVVTRYFGGIKLGAGGLTRAYGKSATLGLAAAGLVSRILCHRFIVTLDYTCQGGLENQLLFQHFTVLNRVFSEQVMLTILSQPERVTELIQLINENTSGTGKIEFKGTEYSDGESNEADLR